VITEIEIEGFKSLEKVHLKLGGFNLLIGANASGKSNFFEALRVLQGIGYGFRIAEILNGKPKGATSEVWEGIRGGSSKAKFAGPRSQKLSTEGVLLRVALDAHGTSHRGLYSIEISPDYGTVTSEELRIGSTVAFSRKGDSLEAGYDISDLGPPREWPALTVLDIELTLEENQEEARKALLRMLVNMQGLSPSPDVLRDYGSPFLVKRMGDSGENFPSLIKAILGNPAHQKGYLSWLQQMVPFEGEGIKILEGALGEPLFALKKGEQEFPARILSDGTLRFAALAAAFFQPDMPDILTLEEIENGIHPSRLRLLVELLKSQSAAGTSGGPQVFATTHSPIVLAWLEESDYETTFLCKRDEETGASIIKPLSEIPHLVEMVRKQPISELFAEGWLEGAF
jgi:energy-coupling factor transporter ATP-binding protein EcfA2